MGHCIIILPRYHELFQQKFFYEIGFSNLFFGHYFCVTNKKAYSNLLWNFVFSPSFYQLEFCTCGVVLSRREYLNSISSCHWWISKPTTHEFKPRNFRTLNYHINYRFFCKTFPCTVLCVFKEPERSILLSEFTVWTSWLSFFRFGIR